MTLNRPTWHPPLPTMIPERATHRMAVWGMSERNIQERVDEVSEILHRLWRKSSSCSVMHTFFTQPDLLHHGVSTALFTLSFAHCLDTVPPPDSNDLVEAAILHDLGLSVVESQYRQEVLQVAAPREVRNLIAHHEEIGRQMTTSLNYLHPRTGSRILAHHAWKNDIQPFPENALIGFADALDDSLIAAFLADDEPQIQMNEKRLASHLPDRIQQVLKECFPAHFQLKQLDIS